MIARQVIVDQTRRCFVDYLADVSLTAEHVTTGWIYRWLEEHKTELIEAAWAEFRDDFVAYMRETGRTLN